MMLRCVLIGLLWLLAGVVGAHTLSVSHLDIVVGEDGRDLQIELDLALRDLALTLPLDSNGDELITWGELSAVRKPLQALVSENLRFSTAKGDCALQPRGLATRKYDDGAYATVQLSGTCGSSSALDIQYGLIFDRDPQHRALITVHRGEAVTTAIARPGADTVSIALDGVSRSPFLDYLREGVHHILIGYDHLAFVMLLLLPAVLQRTDGRWVPVQRFRAALIQVAGIVTAFTVAHSLTLTAAALGLVRPYSHWVEAAIAASVLLAALNNVWPLVVRRLWLAGFGFGLIHGFGFAGALSELGLPSQARVVSLLGFNLGVELGQLAVVAAVLPLVFAARNQHWYSRFGLRAVSLAIGALAAWWLFQRVS